MKRLDVTLSELQNGSQQMQTANQAFVEAANNMKSAAAELAETWVGVSRDAFVAEQEQIDRWYKEISEVVENYARAMAEAAQDYSDIDQQAAGAIRST